ncbi:hypothetical protein [Actinophytocola sediminis]
MNPDQQTATLPTATLPTEHAPVAEPPGNPVDPLARITLTPRRFATLLAGAGLLLGLILALVPVHVASLDEGRASSVSCGNAIGGVETPLLTDDLGDAGPTVIATYVGTCQDAIGTRMLFAWPMFFAGMIGIVWLGAVRREPLPEQLAGVEHA